MAIFQKIIVLIDMDCFYCQVEEQLNPDIAGKPVAVVQYDAWHTGGLIAVNYPARNCGVTRHMRGMEAKKVCPELMLVSVPTTRGKSDTTRYKDAGKRVADVFVSFTSIVERASVDEAYLDITELVEDRLRNNYMMDFVKFENTRVVGYEIGEYVNSLDLNLNEQDYRLAIGAIITEEIRTAVYNVTGYHCSAGIAHNKILAKLAAGMHKPNQQTILPQASIVHLYETLPINKIRSLGGKFGEQVTETLHIKFMSELYKYSENELREKFDIKTGSFLYNIARGIDNDPVTIRQKSKSIACSKNFFGPTALVNLKDLKEWINDLSIILSERLTKDYEEYHRKARNIVVIFTYQTSSGNVTNSRTYPLNSYDPSKIAKHTFEILDKHCIKNSDKFKIKHIGMSASKFEDYHSSRTLKAFFDSTVATKKNQQEDVIGTCSKSDINEEIMSLILKKKSQEDDDLVQNDDIYEASTISLDYDDRTNLSYVDESLECHDEDCRMTDSSDKDSITNETFYTKAENLDESSFFNNYFKEEEERSVKRHFDTSRQLEIMDVDDRTNANKSNNEIVKKVTPNEEFCAECKKLILTKEMPSHKDYHFALKLCQDETTIRTPYNDKLLKKEVKSKTKQKLTKRKQENYVKLTTFLRNTDVPEDEPSETCRECTKKISVREMKSHLDYHVAKKLHQELNRSSTSLSTTRINARSNTISSYFKPT